jgi:hypothetical protein
MLLVPLSTFGGFGTNYISFTNAKFIYTLFFSKMKTCEGKIEESFGIFENVLFSKLNIQN